MITRMTGASQHAFTVFTPTFNRRPLLPRLYDSLCRQTFRDFEWLVIDDGSTDGTAELIRKWAGEAGFPLRYAWQANSGKHAAINRAVAMASGYHFLIQDSDDWFAPTALERIQAHWDQIPSGHRMRYTGIVGLFAAPDGSIVDGRFPRAVMDADAIELAARYGFTGDKFGSNRTEVLREFPFPQVAASYVCESLVWNRIAQKYTQRCVNEVFAFKEYLKGGLTDQNVPVKVRAWSVNRLYYQECVGIPRSLPIGWRLRKCVNYVRFSMHGKVTLRQQAVDIPRRLFWILSLPLGYLLYRRDRARLPGEIRNQ